ncbi:transposase [Symbiopectobacterium purcellii]|uniref:transposase n=1 Tax=Symbiopectobacterium purcellii TaxID=2871826 RepID=UPI003F853C66
MRQRSIAGCYQNNVAWLYMVEYLPTYSPDLNPIEHKWAQAKSKKREMGCDTESLFSVHMV